MGRAAFLLFHAALLRDGGAIRVVSMNQINRPWRRESSAAADCRAAVIDGRQISRT
jgi:hypothetical protein